MTAGGSSTADPQHSGVRCGFLAVATAPMPQVANVMSEADRAGIARIRGTEFPVTGSDIARLAVRRLQCRVCFTNPRTAGGLQLSAVDHPPSGYRATIL